MSSSLVSIFAVGVLLASHLASAKVATKRGIPDFGLSSFSGGYSSSIPSQDISFGFELLAPQPLPVFIKPSPPVPSGITIQKQISYQPPVSPAEIASAIAAAKAASNRVQYLQNRVQQAKQALVEQQRAASMQEAAAAEAARRSEAASAAQRAAASAASSAVVRAQQQLAEAKADVSEQQRVAAAKEALAAHVIRESANAAAAAIQRTEDTANKIAALQRSEASAAIKHVAAAKQASLAATAAAVSAVAAASEQHNGHQPSNGSSDQQYPSPGPKYHPWN